MAAQPEEKVLDFPMSDASLTPLSFLQEEMRRCDRMGGVPGDLRDMIHAPPEAIEVIAGKQRNTISYVANEQFRMNRTNRNNTHVTLCCVYAGLFYFYFLFFFKVFGFND